MTKFETNLSAVIEELQNKDVAQDAKDVDLQNQIDSEIAKRTNADDQLQTNINAEANARTAADKDLQGQIAKEVADRVDADKVLQANIDEEIAARTNADETESSTRASTDQDLQKQIDFVMKYLVPVGAIEYFARTSSPEGWLKADGSAVSRSEYANLFAAVGTMFGAGDGSTTFNVPDLRGEFIRGLDDGRGIDLNRTLGSWQKPSLVNGDYNENKSVVTLGGLPQNRSVYGWEDPLSSGHVSSEGSYWWAPSTIQVMRELDMRLCGVIRPRNVALLACIKY
jgi:phage-related tail fiber protein